MVAVAVPPLVWAAALAMRVLLSRRLFDFVFSLVSRLVFSRAIAALPCARECLAMPPCPRQAPRPAFADMVPSLHITPCEVSWAIAGLTPASEAIIKPPTIAAPAAITARCRVFGIMLTSKEFG